jgi:thiamine-monophosphate kinase
MAHTIQSIGEQGLLQIVQRFCPADVVGDDAAVLSIAPHESLVVTTDLFIDHVHFSDRTTPPHAVGWRAIAANLSDLAAMGATPIGVTVGLGLPATTAVDWVESVYQGMRDCLIEFGGTIVGGDLVRAPVRTIAITAFGQVEPGKVMRRSGAQVGDVIVVTGDHGSARAGLELLLNPELGRHDHRSDHEHEQLIKAHQYPVPRVAIGQQVKHFATACMDSSDGLADAIWQICRASQVGAILDQALLPIAPALPLMFPDRAIDWSLYGGEDFELVLCLPVAAVPDGCTIVGRIVASPLVQLVDAMGNAKTLSGDRGFQHF